MSDIDRKLNLIVSELEKTAYMNFKLGNLSHSDGASELEFMGRIYLGIASAIREVVKNDKKDE